MFIQTFGGTPFHFEAPVLETISLVDIGEHLSKINRFVGATRVPISVAEHSVCAMGLAAHEYPERSVLTASTAFEAARGVHVLRRLLLLHDAHEAYVGDMSSPLKELCPDYRRIEEIAQTAVRKRFSIHESNGINLWRFTPSQALPDSPLWKAKRANPALICSDIDLRLCACEAWDWLDAKQIRKLGWGLDVEGLAKSVPSRFRPRGVVWKKARKMFYDAVREVDLGRELRKGRMAV